MGEWGCGRGGSTSTHCPPQQTCTFMKPWTATELELYRACALIVSLYSLDRICCWQTLHTRPVGCSSTKYNVYNVHMCIVGMVDGYGYDGQWIRSPKKFTICDACRPYHSILHILNPVFQWILQIGCAYNSLRCLDIQIWWFCVHDDNNDDRADYFTCCACAQANKYILEASQPPSGSSQAVSI